MGNTTTFNTANQHIRLSLYCATVNNNSTSQTSHLLTVWSPNPTTLSLLMIKLDLPINNQCLYALKSVFNYFLDPPKEVPKITGMRKLDPTCIFSSDDIPFTSHKKKGWALSYPWLRGKLSQQSKSIFIFKASFQKVSVAKKGGGGGRLIIRIILYPGILIFYINQVLL